MREPRTPHQAVPSDTDADLPRAVPQPLRLFATQEIPELPGVRRSRRIHQSTKRVLHYFLKNLGSSIDAKQIWTKSGAWDHVPLGETSWQTAVSAAVKRLNALLAEFAEANPDASYSLRIDTQRETGKKGYTARLTQLGSRQPQGGAEEGLGDARWWSWRGRTPLAIELLWSALEPTRGVHADDVGLLLTDEPYDVPEPIQSMRAAFEDAYIRDRKGKAVDNLRNYRMMDYVPIRDEEAHESGLSILGQPAMYLDFAVTNQLLNWSLAQIADEVVQATGRPPETFVWQLLGTTRREAMARCANLLAVNTMLILKDTDEFVINRRGDKLAENWGQFGPSLSGTIILTPDLLCEPHSHESPDRNLAERAPMRVDLTSVVKKMAFQELGIPGNVEPHGLTCVGLANGLKTGHCALMMYATLDLSPNEITELLQRSNKWETQEIHMVPCDPEAVCRFMDREDILPDVRRTPYTELCCALALYSRDGSGVLSRPD